MPSSNPLPPKENALFKRILKCYEQKQYKNGLKFAKQILSNTKYAEHGETLAMKGLTLNCLGRKEEAYEYVRRGLKNDLNSHVCWHVYGLLQRSDKKYDEAIKCYRNALKRDPENIQILRDLSLLQIQMRDLDGYKETRYQLFQLRPTQRASWIGIAMSYHLVSDYDKALAILDEFRKTQQGVNREVVGQVIQALYHKKAAYDYEQSELLLYQNMVIQESQDYEAALEHLDRYQDQICDKLALAEIRGANLIKAHRLDEAAQVYRQLLLRNPENHLYYEQLAVALGVSEQPSGKLQMLQELLANQPKVQAPQRLALNVAHDQTFADLVSQYIKKALRKGVPPLFVDLVPLYQDAAKVQLIERIGSEWLQQLQQTGCLEPQAPAEAPTVLLWLYYYMAQHYDHKQDFERALVLVEKAIEHTPTLIELFLLKGKIYKHVGDMDSAVACLDEAQSLDTADRYINCKCAKYLLLANRVSEAEAMCQKFTRKGVTAMDDLNEMQCMWFQTECAEAYRRMGKYGDALKKCFEVDRHFNEIIEDQFDFHTYCMRKMTLRSYVELLRLEDVLRCHKFFKKAAHCAIQVYLSLYDEPLKEDQGLQEVDAQQMDPSELKKLRNKMKKVKRKAELEKQSLQQAAARKELHHKSQKKSDGTAGGTTEEFDSPAKDDLQPDKLERPEEPLQEAIKFLQPLQQLASSCLRTHLFAFEIYYRKGKVLLMLQSVKRALQLQLQDALIHSCLVRFQWFVEQHQHQFCPAVRQVLDTHTQTMFAGISAKERNERFIQTQNSDYADIVVGAEMQALLDPSSVETALQRVIQMQPALTGLSIKLCSQVLDHLVSGDFGPSGKKAADGYRSQCQALFRHATKFRSSHANLKNNLPGKDSGLICSNQLNSHQQEEQQAETDLAEC